MRLPRLFFDDHCDRLAGEVPLPEPVQESGRFVWVNRDDPGMEDLISDAKHYADPAMYQERLGGCAENRWICKAAQRLLQTIVAEPGVPG